MIPTFDTWVEIENDKDKDKYIYFLSKWGGSNYIFLEIGEDSFELLYEFKFPQKKTTFNSLVLLTTDLSNHHVNNSWGWLLHLTTNFFLSYEEIFIHL